MITAFEIKNAAISSHPDEWELSNNLWQNPTYSGRLGFRPNPAWNHGISFSIGPYLYSEAQPFLPPGKGLNDYNEIVLDYDVSYAWHHWQFWGEVFLTRFEVPNVGNADVLTYYLEARYQITSDCMSQDVGTNKSLEALATAPVVNKLGITT